MTKFWYRSAYARLSLWVVLATALAPRVVADGSVSVPLDYFTFLPPAVGGSYTDAAFGTSIKRISNALGTADAARSGSLPFITAEYSTMRPFNTDNSRMLIVHPTASTIY